MNISDEDTIRTNPVDMDGMLEALAYVVHKISCEVIFFDKTYKIRGLNLDFFFVKY